MEKTYWWLYLGDCETKQDEIDFWQQEGFSLFVSNKNKGKDEYFEDGDEPDWDDVEGIIKNSGFVPEYDFRLDLVGFFSECTISFLREDQSEEIKNMSWDEVYSLILDKFNCRVIR